MRRAALFAPAGEVGSITSASIAETIDRGVADVTFEVDFDARTGLVVDLDAVGAGSSGVVAGHIRVGDPSCENPTTSDAIVEGSP